MIWKVIPGFSRYEISEDGQVRKSINALPSKGGRNHKNPGELLNPSFNDKKDKYLVVHLQRDIGGSKVCKIHTLVAITFHGPKPDKYSCALHKNDDRYNNHHSNIYWGTKQQNSIDRTKNGHCGNSKLTVDQVKEIRKLRNNGWLQRDLASKFNVSPEAISQMLRSKSYIWVK